MSTIQLEIEDTLIKAVGVDTIKDMLEWQISRLKVKYLGDKISAEIDQAGIDPAHEIEEARKEAWEEYKATHLKNIL